MPIYEYVCQSCANRFEVKQKMIDPPLTSCLRCGEPVTKVISAPAIMFKGSGWYVTDYSDKMKPPGQSESAGKPANGQGEKKSGEPASKDAATTSATPASTPSSPAPAGTASTTGSGSSGTGAPSSGSPSSSSSGSGSSTGSGSGSSSSTPKSSS